MTSKKLDWDDAILLLAAVTIFASIWFQPQRAIEEASPAATAPASFQLSLERTTLMEVDFDHAIVRATHGLELRRGSSLFAYGVTPVSWETGEVLQDTLWTVLGPEGYAVGDTLSLASYGFRRYDDPTGASTVKSSRHAVYFVQGSLAELRERHPRP